ncbi:hypothetical protein GOBAR_DD07554 [Gossypium barbadense]|nr:hypothetical protein GOBAR_DD07554 [Gossypium barbadense]
MRTSGRGEIGPELPHGLAMSVSRVKAGSDILEIGLEEKIGVEVKEAASEGGRNGGLKGEEWMMGFEPGCFHAYVLYQTYVMNL